MANSSLRAKPACAVGYRVAQAAGGQLPVRVLPVELASARHGAAEAEVCRGGARQQPVARRRPVRVDRPHELATGLLPADDEVDGALDRGPELLEETSVACDEKVVPHPGRQICTDVGVEAGLFDLSASEIVGVPRPVGTLGRAEPFVARSAAASRAPPTVSAMADSTWFHGSAWPPENHGIMPSFSCTARMESTVSAIERPPVTCRDGVIIDPRASGRRPGSCREKG